MKNKKIIKIISIILISLIIMHTTNIVFAANGLNLTPFENSSAANETEKVSNLVNSTAYTTIAVMRIVAVTIAIVMLLTISMKYMLASAGDRADIKKHAVAYVVGAVILFSVTGILGILVDLSQKFKS